MKKIYTLLSLMIISVASSAQCSGLIFSEYIEGSSSNKALEIYNSSGSSIDLSNYAVIRMNNGSTTSPDTFRMNGMLASEAVYVIANSSADAAILALADTTGSATFYNGDDALTLANITTSTVVDLFGIPGEDPGSAWTWASGATNNSTLVRNYSVQSGVATWDTLEWVSSIIDDFSNLGFHVSSCYPPSAPMTAAADPTALASNVISLFSNVYTDVTVNTWKTTWSVATLEDIQVDGNDVKKYSNLDFVGIEAVSANSIDASGMQYISFDAWTPNATTYRIKLVDFGADNAAGGGDDTEHEIAFTNPTQVTWTNHTILLSDFTGLASQSNISQIILSALPTGTATLVIDNVYFSTIPSPEVSFTNTTMEVDENAGTATIEVTIANASATDTTKVEVSVTGGSAVITTDYAITSSVMLEFLPGSSTSQTVSMSIVDNSTADGNKTVELDLSNVSSNATIGDNSSMLVTIIDDEYKVADIADAINLDGDLAATNEGSKFELTGVVYGGDLDGNAGISFTIIDATGGMNIFNFRDVNDYVVTEGDEITVRGEIDFYNGLLELFADSILVNSSGNTLKSATQVEAPSEATESDFIVLRKVWITNDTTTLWPDNQNVELTNDDMDTFQIRIDRDIPGIVGMPVEFDTMTITGLGGQFDGSAPYNEGYQIFPRGLSDIAEYVDRSSVTESVIETRVYPNPTSKNLTVIGTQKWNTYQVFNILGGIVLEGSLSNNNLSVSDLNTGTYIVKLYAGENTGVARFVVNR
jgi:hypothetical protein